MMSSACRLHGKRRTVVFILLVFLNLFCSNAFARETCLKTSWPSDYSPLRPDPALLRGRFDNGFRYVLMRHGEPRNRVALYLLVNAGSFNETDEQRGYAHFLEHMMFNGTKNFPSGHLVEYFQSIGMDFGGDTNAFTSFDRTIYTIVLPQGDEGSLDKGMMVLADYADGALLYEEEINKERGVILAEKRDRDSADYRTYVASSEYAFKGTLIPKRMIIGADETLMKVNHDSLQSYYDRWYRPDNMILVAVGDMDPVLAMQFIKKRFGGFKPRGPEPKCPDLGLLGKKNLAPFYHYEPQLGKTEIALQSYWDVPEQNDSEEVARVELLRLLSTMIMGYRLQRQEEEDSPPFVNSAYNQGMVVQGIGYATLSAETDKLNWAKSLHYMEAFLRQAEKFGFLPEEVDRARKEVQAKLEEGVLTADSRDSRSIAMDVIDHLGDNRVYLSPQQERDLYTPLLRRISAGDVNREFINLWKNGNFHVSVTGDVWISGDAPNRIKTVFQESRTQELRQPLRNAALVFPYLELVRPASPPVKTVEYDKIGVKRFVFPNGLIVNIKQTPFEKNIMRVAAMFGNGQLVEQRPGLALLVERVINGSGTERLPQSVLDRIVAGSGISLNFSVDESSFAWNGQALTKDFELLLQLMYTVCYDPGLKESVYQNVKTDIEMMYRQLGQTVDGAFPLRIEPFLAEYTQGFGLPPLQAVRTTDFQMLIDWAKSMDSPQDLELSLVGDFDEAKTLKLIQKYFGGVRLQTWRPEKIRKVSFPKGKQLEVGVNSDIKKSMVLAVWPTGDSRDIKRTRRLNILAAILEDRLRSTIREQLGATYSPEAFSNGSRIYEGYGYLLAQSVVEPGKEKQILDAILAIGRDLYQDGISEDELLRARDPVMTNLKESVQTNEYWLSSVLTLSSRYPQQLNWPTTILSDYSAINTNEINMLARKFLDTKDAATIIVQPVSNWRLRKWKMDVSDSSTR